MRWTKLTPLCLALVLACGGPATEEVDVAEEGESASVPAAASSSGPEAAVVAQLNEMCEENWCDGPFDYEFLALECGESSCELFFRAERDGERFEDSVVFDYDEPLLDEGELEAGYWERITDALLDEWEPAQEAG